MAQSITCFCLLLWWINLSLVYSSSSSSGKENQHCDNGFYCLTKDQCFDRNLRCTSSKVCTNSNGNEAGCFESSDPGKYYYYKKKSPILSSGSKRKRSISDTKHWFVEYRGFVYEFGGTYGLQELDVNDPNYKYGPGREKVSSEENMGSSSCTRDQVLAFNKRWLEANPKYRLFTNNCQDFSKQLLRELGRNCPNRVRREDGNTESLEASECLSSEASSSFRWKPPAALFAPLISFAIFYNIYNWTLSVGVVWNLNSC